MFYAPDIAVMPVLPVDEARHCLRVLRLNRGDTIDVTDGKGGLYRAALDSTDAGDCRLVVSDVIHPPDPWTGFVEIAVAPTKNYERMEWFVEKAVEIGINRISFINCRFSERHEIKPERIRRVMIAAMKQSLKAILPELREIVDFDRYIVEEFNGISFIAHCHETEKPLLANVCPKGGNVRVLIGPEGDFSEKEVESAINNGIVPVSLGKSRLRTETAALVACQTVHLLEQLI
jgi:16S rRNA (uracil1498-N3)-methyltransferase